MMVRAPIVFATVGLALSVCGADIDIRAHGAAEGTAPAANAVAIQKAIDAAAAEGGGRVIVPAGTYTSGTIWLKRNVELHLEKGAVLKASDNLADYNPEDAYPENFGVPYEYWKGHHFIIARQADGASITGEGTVHGNGDAFYEAEPKAHYEWMKPGSDAWWNGIRWAKDKKLMRPGQLIVFLKSNRVAVRGITIRNSPCWSLYFWGCEHVRVSDYTVRNGENDGNSDGIDFDCTRDVVLERADIDTGDDAIAIRANNRFGKLGLPDVTDGIVVRDCRLRSTSSVIRLGVGTGVIRNITFENVTCDRGGTAIMFLSRIGKPERSGCDIENVTMRNCRFENCVRGPDFRAGGVFCEFGIRNISISDCSFNAPPAYHNDPDAKFPVSEKDVVFNRVRFK